MYLDTANGKSYTGANWNDLSGNENTANLINSPTFDEDKNGSLSLDGTNQWSNVIVSPVINNDFTFIAWAKRDGNTSTGIGGIFGNHFHTQLSGAGMFFRNASTYVDMSAGNGTSRPSHRVNIPRSNLEWNFYCIRYTGTNYQFYFNGELLDSRTAVVIQSSSTNNFAIGRWASSYGSYYLNGNISNCIAYNISLSPEQIKQNFNATKYRFGL